MTESLELGICNSESCGTGFITLRLRGVKALLQQLDQMRVLCACPHREEDNA